MIAEKLKVFLSFLSEACVACLHRFGSARSPSQVSESLRQIILRLYDKHLASDGKALNYKALKQDPVFKTYVNSTAELQKVDVVSLNREERMAFFINIYNAVVVHALAVFGPASNLKQRSGSHVTVPPTMLIFALCMYQAFVRVLHAAAEAFHAMLWHKHAHDNECNTVKREEASL
jgi:hypothetical protein